MAKKIITIKIEIDVPESNVGKFVVPTHNYSEVDENDAYLADVPCKILSEPYMATVKTFFGTSERRELVDVKSMVSNIKYTIPTSLFGPVYDTLAEANKHAKIQGVENPRMKDLIGKKYYPFDNSWNKDLVNGMWHNLVDSDCIITGLPFKEPTGDPLPDVRDKKMVFVHVLSNGQVHRVLYGDWGLIPGELRK